MTNRTLIVDDDDVISLGLQDFLNFRGCEADTAHDYDSARTLMSGRRYAVALVDVMVTGRDVDSGVGFVRWVRDTSPETAVVVLTAYRTAWLDGVAVAAGISHVCDKPKAFDEIVDLVTALTAEPVR